MVCTFWKFLCVWACRRRRGLHIRGLATPFRGSCSHVDHRRGRRSRFSGWHLTLRGAWVGVRSVGWLGTIGVVEMWRLLCWGIRQNISSKSEWPSLLCYGGGCLAVPIGMTCPTLWSCPCRFGIFCCIGLGARAWWLVVSFFSDRGVVPRSFTPLFYSSLKYNTT